MRNKSVKAWGYSPHMGLRTYLQGGRETQESGRRTGYPWKMLREKTMKTAILAVLMLLPGLVRAEKYSLKDEGDFAPLGQRVEFADRYGWRRYQVDFDFGLDESNRSLSRGSKLHVKILRRDGSSWKYTCKAKNEALTANVNYIHGRGISVVVDCRISQKEFAKAVDLDKDDVGFPTLVFHAMIQDGQVTAGAQRGLYFTPGGQLQSSEMNAYAAVSEDPTNLAVVFRSN